MAARRPPGPSRAWFGIPLLAEFRRDSLGYLMRLHRDYGDVSVLKIGPYWQHFFFHPDAIKELLITKARAFRRFTHPMRVLKQWNGNSVLIAEGDEWLRKRRMVQPALHARRFAAYAASMIDESVGLRDRWQTQLAAAPGVRSLTLDVEPEMIALTLAIIGRTMFGTDLAGQSAAIGGAVAALSRIGVREFESPFILPRWLPTPGNREKQAAIRTLDGVVWRLIRDRRERPADRGDLLSALLMETASGPDGDPARLSETEVRDELMTMLLAGHDTTAAGLVWTLYHLAANPDVQRDVQSQIDVVLAGKPLQFANLERLDVLGRAIKESLRLSPPAIGVFFRQALEEVEIGGWRLKRGELAGAFSWVVHRDPRWFPDPERFDPDRFLPERQAALPQCAYFPFGAGPRMCIGAQFATLEITIALSTLLQTFSVSLPPDALPPVPLALMSLRPQGGMRLKWEGRGGLGGEED